MSALLEANELNERGRLHLDVDRLDEAEACFRRAVALAPSLDWAWFNLGLVHKRRHDWPQCLEANRRASALTPARGEPAWWNLGIAATAVGDWDTARRAWAGFGLDLPGGEGPIDGDLGLGVVRLHNGEVVWGRRMDPCRVRVLNVPLADSGHHWCDVVLHDGEPRGHRRLHGRDLPVFDELERLHPSPMGTLLAEVECDHEQDVDALVMHFHDGGYGAEDWTASIRLLCRDCSEGTPGHDHDEPSPWTRRRQVGLAAPEPMARELLRVWARNRGADVRSLRPVA